MTGNKKGAVSPLCLSMTHPKLVNILLLTLSLTSDFSHAIRLSLRREAFFPEYPRAPYG